MDNTFPILLIVFDYILALIMLILIILPMINPYENYLNISSVPESPPVPGNQTPPGVTQIERFTLKKDH